ncbi:MAG: FtsX-like permease family protein [Myxococcales bacterium]|nr:FtsX-like permease family protein [Myxococcales bacterium]
MKGLESASLIWRMAWRNVRLQRGKSLIVGAIFLFGTALVVVSSAVVDAMDRGMAHSIVHSLAGHLQLYSKDAKEKLAIYGDEFAGMPDFGVIANFAKVAEVVEKVPGVKAVVPMGSQIAMAVGGNELDRRLAGLRAAVKAGDQGAVNHRVAHIRQLIQLLLDDLETGRALTEDTPEQRQRFAMAQRAVSDEFWAEFNHEPLPALEFLENKIAPLQAEGDFIGLWYLGTDLDAFANEFSTFEVVLGERVPEGQRGFLFNHGFYEDVMKNVVARTLDQLVLAADQGKTLAGDAELRSKRDRAVRQYRRILFQLDAQQNAALTEKLRAFLGRGEGDLAELLQAFLAVDDDTLRARHAWFYEHIAPTVELYKVKVGDELTLRSLTPSGYTRALNIKVWGTFRFAGMERSMIAKQHNLIDLISFRDLFGFMTPQRKKEIDAIRAKVGVEDVAREDAEDALFGGDEALVVDAQAAPTAAPGQIELNAGLAPPKAAERFTQAQIRDGLAQHAAVLLEDESPANVAAKLKEVQQALDAAGLPVQVVDWQAASGMVGQLVVVVRVVLLAVILLLAVVALVVINNTMVMATMERVKEIGTMRAIGAGRKFVVRLFLTETLALGLVAGGLGALLGAGLVAALHAVGVPASNEFTAFMFSGDYLRPTVEVRHLLLALGTVVVIGVLSTFYPARLAARILPAEAMRAGDG